MTNKIKSKSSFKSGIKPFEMKWMVLILILINLLVYFKSLHFGYTYFDDDAIILRNEEFLKDFTNVKYSFTRDAEFQEKRIELYRPLQNLSYFVDVAIFGFKPFAFHLTNLLLHIFNILLIFLLISRLHFSRLTAFFAGLLFSIHPMFAFTVSWIPARGDLILAFWALISLISFIEFTISGKNKYLWVHCISFGLALFSKENALALIPISLVYYFFVANKKINLSIFASFAGYITIGIFYFYLRNESISNIGNGNFQAVNFITNLSGFSESIFYSLIPVNIPLLAFYKTSVSIAGWILFAVLLFFTVYLSDNKRFTIWIVSSLFMLVLPSILYKPQWSVYIYDYLVHRNYLPFIFLLILVISVKQHHFNSIPKKTKILLIGFVTFIFIVFNLLFTESFRDQKHFWTAAVEKNPGSAFAQNYLGNFLFLDGNTEDAIQHFKKAVELKPDFEDSWFNLGNAYLETKQFEDASFAFSNCLKHDSTNTKALNFRASCYLQLKKNKESLEDLNSLIRLEPNNNDHFYNRALFYFLSKDYKQTEVDLQKIYTKDTEDIRVLKLYSLVLILNGETKEALEVSDLLLEKYPTNTEAINNSAYAQFESGNFQKSIELFSKSYEREPKNLDSFLGLLMSTYRLNKAKALQLLKDKKSDFPDLKHSIGIIEHLEANGFVFSSLQKKCLLEIF